MLLKKSEDFVSIGGANSAEITAAESMLSLQFAEEYKEYLADCGVASADGHEFTGIIDSERLNVVEVTRKAKEGNPYVWGAYYVVEDCYIDGIIIWQSSTGEVFQSIGNGLLKKIHDSLAEYFGA